MNRYIRYLDLSHTFYHIPSSSPRQRELKHRSTSTGLRWSDLLNSRPFVSLFIGICVLYRRLESRIPHPCMILPVNFTEHEIHGT